MVYPLLFETFKTAIMSKIGVWYNKSVGGLFCKRDKTEIARVKSSCFG